MITRVDRPPLITGWPATCLLWTVAGFVFVFGCSWEMILVFIFNLVVTGMM